MSSKFLTIKSIVAIGIPLTAVCIQALLRYAMDIDFNSMGITLSAIGIGQIFPFIIFENIEPQVEHHFVFELGLFYIVGTRHKISPYLFVFTVR